ncbi:putative Origin recognition complex subunit 4 [Seiridium cardinale]
MTSEVGSVRRKRTRPQLDDEPSSPPPSAEVVSSAKKRRLNGDQVPEPATSKGFSAIASAIGNVLGYGRRTSAKTTASEEQDDSSRSAYDELPGSEAEAKTKSSPRKPTRTAASYTKLNQKSLKTAKEASKNVYDVPSSGDELEFSTPMGDKTMTPTKAKPVNGSARKSSIKGGKVSLEHEEDDTGEKARKTPSRNQGNRQASAPSAKSQTESIQPPERPAVKAFVTRGRATKNRSPAKQSAPTPKGILTPRHKRPGRPRKNVAFDSEDNKPAEVYFEDLPKEPKSQTARPRVSKSEQQQVEETAASEGDESEDSEEDEVCVVCSKPDSKRGNEIIFCDNCNKAVHQKCYNVPKIPDDDWFCKDCLQEDAASEANGASMPAVGRSTIVPDIPNFEQHLQAMQRALIDRCSGSRRLKLKGQDEAYDKTYQLVEQTVMAGEGNSMMIIGARGCGKTLLVESVLSDLATESSDAFHVVRLSGFIHTDDKLALKEIWRQLGKEMEIEDDLVNKTNNYADTLASLLALLSHPSEITGTEEGITSKSVVFVIDEFDLFATHARQTLLYNLFDIAQARKAPIAVLGLTTRIDVVESLEKRVKSRFSHRYVHLSLPKSLPAYWEICRQGLQVEEEDLESEGLDSSSQGMVAFQKYWNEKIEALQKRSSFQDHLEYQFYTTKSVAAFLTTMILPLSALSTSSLDLKIPSPSPKVVQLDAPDSKLHLLAALSDLDLSLLIAAARLDIVAHTDTVNFAMAYDEYSSQMGKQRVQSASSGMLALGAGGRTWGRAVAGMAWERLVSLGLLIPAGIGGRSNAAHGGLEGKMWKLDVSLEEIPTAVELPGFLVKWCTHI